MTWLLQEEEVDVVACEVLQIHILFRIYTHGIVRLGHCCAQL